MIEQILPELDNSVFNEALAALFLAIINMIEELLLGLWTGAGSVLFGLTSVTTYGGLFMWATMLMMAFSGYYMVTNYRGFD
jgi:hypothetical protein